MSKELSELKELLDSMEYPDNEPYADIEKKDKTDFIVSRAKQYNNVKEVIQFIRESDKDTVSEVFEEIYDSDLFKGD
ncbi:MAG: hypothetical protein IKO27_08265 [Ruminococcus sp.]|nr:hypothetical protein [Ruminococcus sp.]